MASTNPWAKKKAASPRYDGPKQKPDPFSRFSVAPNALTVINNFRAKLAAQEGLNPNGRIPAKYAKDLEVELAPYIDVPGLLKDERAVREYRQHARDNSMLTVDEAKDLIDHSIDYVTSIPVGERSLQVKNPSEVREEYLDEQEQKYEELPADTMLNPYLVNVSWYFEEVRKPTGGRRSPRVKYSIEGTFYATSKEEAIAMGQQFITTYVRPSVVGGGSQVIDLSEDGPDGSGDAHVAVGSQAIEGPSITKRQAEDMEFDPNFRAFFTRRTGKTSDDQNFRDPYYKCKIIKGRYTI